MKRILYYRTEKMVTVWIDAPWWFVPYLWATGWVRWRDDL